MPQQMTRDQIIQTADQLFYERGFEGTSFADIARVLNISRGNFYHHFKTKDQILEAVIDYRISNTKDMIEIWDKNRESPIDRIRCFVQILIEHRTDIISFGCPVGTLTNELSKLDHPSLNEANELFLLFRFWLRQQFKLLGCGQKSDEFSMHLLALSQGVATIASAFKDEKFINQEVRRINEWIDSVVGQNLT